MSLKPDELTALRNRSAFGGFAEALALGERAGRLEATGFSRWSLPQSESEQQDVLRAMVPADGLVSFHLARPKDKEAEQQVLWALLQRKGRLQEMRAIQQRLARMQPELFQRWAIAQRASEECAGPALTGVSLPGSGSENFRTSGSLQDIGWFSQSGACDARLRFVHPAERLGVVPSADQRRL